MCLRYLFKNKKQKHQTIKQQNKQKQTKIKASGGFVNLFESLLNLDVIQFMWCLTIPSSDTCLHFFFDQSCSPPQKKIDMEKYMVIFQL